MEELNEMSDKVIMRQEWPLREKRLVGFDRPCTTDAMRNIVAYFPQRIGNGMAVLKNTCLAGSLIQLGGGYGVE